MSARQRPKAGAGRALAGEGKMGLRRHGRQRLRWRGRRRRLRWRGRPPAAQVARPAPAAQVARPAPAAANPHWTDRLRLDREVRQIEAGIRSSRYREAVTLVSRWAVRPDELQQALLDVEPDIVHFSAHGTADEELVLDHHDSRGRPVHKGALASLFAILKDRIRVVVLNTCHSKPQAAAIAEHIDCAIGMNRALGDRAAIEFAAAFYQAVGYGRSVQSAFDLARNALQLQGISEDQTPELLVRSGVDGRRVVLVRPGGSAGVPGTPPAANHLDPHVEAPERASAEQRESLPATISIPPREVGVGRPSSARGSRRSRMPRPRRWLAASGTHRGARGDGLAAMADDVHAKRGKRFLP
ncbi:CHAT domain-containing protein [Sorangium sp. So ce118]